MKWIVQRINGQVSAIESPIGWMPKYTDIDWTGLSFDKKDYDRIMEVDREAWKAEILAHEELFARMYDKIPKEYFLLQQLLLSSLWRSPEHWYLEPETA